MKKDECMVEEFPLVLNKMLIEKGINQKQLSEGSGVSQALISAYINGKRLPSVANIKKLAEYFDVSPSEFLSFNAKKESTAIKTRRNAYFAKRLNHLMITNAYSQKDMAKLIGISRQTINYYCNGTCYPKPEVINDICELFNVDKSYFDLSNEKMDIVFYVDKVPKYAEQCPLLKGVRLNDDNEMEYICTYGGYCKISNGECSHLKEVPFNRATAN